MSEPDFIDRPLAVMIHERTLVLHGGARGVRDEALLDSALARPRQIAGYEPDADIIRLAAALTFGIVRNHPFVDGNKRTGFVTGVLFLELNGYRFTASEESAAFAVIGLAGGELDETGYEAFLRENAICE
jgi:death-on-curing protein